MENRLPPLSHSGHYRRRSLGVEDEAREGSGSARLALLLLLPFTQASISAPLTDRDLEAMDGILGGKPQSMKVSEGRKSAHGPARLANVSLPAKSFLTLEILTALQALPPPWLCTTPVCIACVYAHVLPPLDPTPGALLLP